MTGKMPEELCSLLKNGTVIPAHPLALRDDGSFDEKHQRALTRYYVAAGAGGVAVGVHSTQFEIRDADVGLFKPVLQLASETVDEAAAKAGRPVLKIAGICGDTTQAAEEAGVAREAGYHAGLVSLKAFGAGDFAAMLEHCRHLAEIIPIVGFYLQTAVGGVVLPYSFWREFAEIENAAAIKIAPFDRYATLDVVRAIADSGREDEIPLYTGNDDNIVMDLVTPFRIRMQSGEDKILRIKGGLLGHWCVWTHGAVEVFEKCSAAVNSGNAVPAEILTLGQQVTDCNAAFFDAAHGFAGCIAGLHEVLCRQGLMESTRCLDPEERLSAGQKEEIDRVYRAYPHLNDDEFVKEHLADWLE